MSKWVFKSPCPACPPGPNNTPSTWTRVSCGHTVYIWDDCDLGCPSCGSYSHILNNRFMCENHKIEEKWPNIQYLYISRCIAVMAQMSEIPYKVFRKLEKAIEDERRKRGLPIDEDDDDLK